MDRAREIALLEELMGLKDNGLFFLADGVSQSPIARYADQARFEAEQAMFRLTPLIAGLAADLPEEGSFFTRPLAGRPILVTRDRRGEVHAFLNVCRHRGARLVDAESGCKHAFSCPYHAWTWSNDGALRGVPHEKPGFPEIDRAAYGLKRLPCEVRGGLIWVVPDADAAVDIADHVAPIEADLAWMGLEDMAAAESDLHDRAANWKLLVEGGIEAYHFKVAHKDTIGPHFLDNLSSYEMLGGHMRSILPRESLPKLADQPHERWAIRDHANVLYNIFPLDQFLVMQDHVAWISADPVAPGQTRLRITTLAPKAEITEEKRGHWKRNHQITSVTLDEDFAINEAQQAGMESGANEAMTFGRYEGALARFNAEVEARL